MNLLIVEDERITREGLLQSLDWPQAGISRVFSAENGEAGLFMAKRIMPDIVLTDIRMPRMDGITMASRIKEILPECRIIFLSAYSEIDYYKAAIDLKAIRYLDKPIESERLRSVISEAVAECVQLRRYKSTHDLHHMQEKQKFADAICAGETEEVLESEYKRLNLRVHFKEKDYCTAIVISFRLDYEDEMQEDLLNFAAVLGDAVAFPSLYTVRHKNRVALLLFTPTEISDYQIKATCKKMQSVLSDHEYFIAVGRPARGIGNANKSYSAAKAVLDKAYLYPWKQAVCFNKETDKTVGISAYAEDKNRILRSVTEGYEREALDACKDLYQKLTNKKDLIYHNARELYFEIISEVFRKADSMHLQIKEDETGEVISWIVEIENYNLYELHRFLCRHISLFFSSMEDAKNEKKQILAIKNYISKNYMSDTFSIGDISAFLHMSASHVCTMFKKETGDTINNYLTEYRLNKAKQYLRETLFTAAEIGVKVGYRDSSYFGRIFRKHFGMTPNEYRNQ